MSLKPILNDSDALDNKSLNLYANTITANNINGLDGLIHYETQPAPAPQPVKEGALAIYKDNTGETITQSNYITVDADPASASGGQILNLSSQQIINGSRIDCLNVFPNMSISTIADGTTTTNISAQSDNGWGNMVRSGSVATTRANVNAIRLLDEYKNVPNKTWEYTFLADNCQLRFTAGAVVSAPFYPLQNPAGAGTYDSVPSAGEIKVVKAYWRPSTNLWVITPIN